MPLNPKSLQGLRNLFKPAEAAISTAPEIKGALTTIAESPQAPSMLEAVMNKDMSRREFMKRGAATTANQAIPRTVQSLVTKELVKEALPTKLQVATEKQIKNNLDSLDLEDLGGVGALDYYLGAMSPKLKSYLWDQYQFGLHPSNNKLLYDPEKLPEVQKTIDRIMDESPKAWDQFGLTSDSDVDYSGTYIDTVLQALKGLNLTPEEKALAKIQNKRNNLWDQISFTQDKGWGGMNGSDLHRWVTDPTTPENEVKDWAKGISKGYLDRYNELNQSALSNPDLIVSHRLIGPKLPKGTIDSISGSKLPELPYKDYEIGDYLSEYLKSMEP